MYTLNFSFINTSCNIEAISSFSPAITTAVGINCDTSSAWLGPDNAATLLSGKISFITSVYNFSVSFSIPFEHNTNTCSFVTKGFILFIVSLIALDGVTINTILVFCNALAKSV